MIPGTYQLAEVNGVFNAVRLNGDFVGPTLLYGSGANMDATASAVMGDVMSISRDQIKSLPIKAMSEIVSHYYLRFTTIDQPGVLATIAGCLGRYDISIQSMFQPEGHEGGSVSIVLMTHAAKEENISNALKEIGRLDFISQPTCLIRVEHDLD